MALNEKNELMKTYTKLNTIAKDETIQTLKIPEDSLRLDFNNLEQIIEWIDSNGKICE